MENIKNRDNTFNVFVNSNLKENIVDKRVAIAMEIRECTDAGKVEAELVFNNGESLTIEWNNIAEREKHLHMINGYTLIYDTREKKAFKSWKVQ